MTVIANLLLGVLAVILAAGFGGGLHPAGDSLAVFRVPVAAAMLLVWLIWRPRGPWGALPALFAAAAMVGVIVASVPRVGAGPLRLYQRNLLHTNTAAEQLAEDIRTRRPDVVTLQEVSDRNAALLQMLARDYPHQVLCPFSGWNGIAILSRYPFRPGSDSCSERRSFASARVVAPQGVFRLYSVHLYWPWPHGQVPQRDRLMADLAAQDGPFVIAGDFNMVPWSRTLAELRRASGTQLAGPVRATRWLGGLPLPIDHVLAPGGGRVKRLDRLGSDHAGLWAEIGL
ncbi:endonuclease/exonuclease/phosphatase family protein [Actibacterium ureilyticum]|uniref:endonuclease/exonuclease/phosphatase family protein n=1 Tax=Actibacterium ureilyticum TaxID=1590614 RepID=UPI000BAADA26|nr:endonuclease/exonuclease/phosphatase family protein [Actibacterium ureilyticum]